MKSELLFGVSTIKRARLEPGFDGGEFRSSSAADLFFWLKKLVILESMTKGLMILCCVSLCFFSRILTGILYPKKVFVFFVTFLSGYW